MSVYAQPSRVAQLLKVLPGPVLRLLDAWSYRVAQRRQQRRREAWLARRAVQR